MRPPFTLRVLVQDRPRPLPDSKPAPPADPVNALPSYAYSLLVRTRTVALTAVGFDCYRGSYHQPRYARSTLSLAMMEPFRPMIADSAVPQPIINGEVMASDFISTSAGSCGGGRRPRAPSPPIRAPTSI